jgi:hypothetical protein
MAPLGMDELNGPGGEGYQRMIKASAAGRVGTDEIGTAAAFLMAATARSSPAPTCSSAATDWPALTRGDKQMKRVPACHRTARANRGHPGQSRSTAACRSTTVPSQHAMDSVVMRRSGVHSPRRLPIRLCPRPVLRPRPPTVGRSTRQGSLLSSLDIRLVARRMGGYGLALVFEVGA